MAGMAAWTSGSAGQDQGAGEGSIDLSRVLFGRKLLLTFCTLMGAALAYLHYTKSPPLYLSSAQILVSRQLPKLPIETLDRQTNNSNYDPLNTHRELFTTPVILNRAVKEYELTNLLSLAGSGNPASDIAGGLTVERSIGSKEILNLKYTGKVSNDCERILNAVIGSYRKFIEDQQRTSNDKTLQLINEAKDKLLVDLDRKENEYQRFRDQVTLLGSGTDGQSVHQQRLSMIEGSRSEIMIERSRTRAQLEQIEDAVERGASREALTFIVEELGRIKRSSEESAAKKEMDREKAREKAAKEWARTNPGAEPSASVDTEKTVPKPPSAVAPPTVTSPTAVAQMRAAMQAQLKPLVLEETLLQERVGAEHPRLKEIRRKIAIAKDWIRQEEQELELRLDEERLARERWDRDMAKREQDELDRIAKEKEDKRREQLQREHDLRVESERQERERIERERAEEPVNLDSAQRLDTILVYIDSLKHRLSLLDRQSEELNRQFEEERENARGQAADENKNRAMREDIERTKRLFDVIIKQLQEVDLTKNEGTLFVEEISPPAPGYQVAPNFNRIVGAGILLGLATGILLGFLLEVTDKSFRNSEDVLRHLGLPVIGHVPLIETMKRSKTRKDSPIDASVTTFHQPQSTFAEAYRSVRAALYFGLRGQLHRVIQVTSPDQGDGKSTLSANLAVAIALSGRKCLLIDADARRPNAHKLFGMVNDRGLTSIILGGADIPDVVRQTEIENLSVLTTGPRCTNPAELILSPKFDHLLAVVKEQYDFVLIDTPPVLAVSDPVGVAAHADGVILVVRIARGVKPRTRRARESLELVGARMIGIVVNGVGQSSSYNYKYSYSYRGYTKYGYGYTDGEMDNLDEQTALSSSEAPTEVRTSRSAATKLKPSSSGTGGRPAASRTTTKSPPR